MHKKRDAIRKTDCDLPKIKSETAYLLLLCFMSIVIFLLFTDKTALLTGRITAQGGYIDELDVHLEHGASQWASIYGNIYEDASTSKATALTVTGGTVTNYNFTFLCVDDQLYASAGYVSDWSKVSAGSAAMVDDYIAPLIHEAEAADRMFTSTELYGVRDERAAPYFTETRSFKTTAYNFSIPTTYTLSADALAFDVGILNYLGMFVMVTNIVTNKTGFDNKQHDYQLLVPVNNGPARYYFFTDCENEQFGQTFRSVLGGSIAHMKIQNDKSPITELNISVKNNLTNFKVRVGSSVIPLEGITPPDGIVYIYTSITKENAEDSDIENALITSAVNTSWIQENNIDRATITMSRYVNAQWVRLSSQETGESDWRVSFQAVTPGFSVFVIHAQQKSEAVPTRAGVMGGGGGGGGKGVLRETIIPTAVQTWAPVPAGSELLMHIWNTKIPISKIFMKLNRALPRLKVTVNSYDRQPPQVSPVASVPYQYLQVLQDGAQNNDFSEIRLWFDVKQAWVAKNKLNPKNIALYIHQDNKWQKLPTTYLGGGSDYSYEAVAKSFSFFAIVAEPEINKEATAIAKKPVLEKPQRPVAGMLTASTRGIKSGINGIKRELDAILSYSSRSTMGVLGVLAMLFILVLFYVIARIPWQKK